MQCQGRCQESGICRNLEEMREQLTASRRGGRECSPAGRRQALEALDSLECRGVGGCTGTRVEFLEETGLKRGASPHGECFGFILVVKPLGSFHTENVIRNSALVGSMEPLTYNLH